MPQPMSTSPFSMDVSATTFSPGDRITVTLYTQNPRQMVRGFFIQTIQANINIRDLRRNAFGRFENLTVDEKPSPCQPTGNIQSGGVTHSNNRGKQSVRVVWIAPESFNPGPVQFLATGVFNYDTYWTDIRSSPVTPTGFPTSTEYQIQGQLTPTAAWYRWLQYIRQSQLLQQNTNQKQEGAVTDASNLNGGAKDASTHKIGEKTKEQNTTADKIRKDIAHSHGHSRVGIKIHNERKATAANLPIVNSAFHSNSARKHTVKELKITDHAHPDHDHNIHHR